MIDAVAYHKNVQRMGFVLCLALVGALVTGCGPREPEVAAMPDVSVAPGLVEATALQPLHLMPASADFAIATPALGHLHDRGFSMATHLAADKDELNAAYHRLVAEQQMRYGVSDAADLQDILRGTGIDPTRPMAFFATMEALDPASDATPGSWAAVGEMLLESAPMTLILPLESPEAGAMLARNILSNVARTPVETYTARSYQGVELHEADEEDAGGYFVLEDWLVVGRPFSMVQETADRLHEPAPIRYGTAECPAEDPDEVALLAHPQQLAKVIDLLLAMDLVTDMASRSFLALQAQSLRVLTDPDPAVVTMHLKPDGLSLTSRLDTARHVALAPPPEAIAPLTKAALVPGDSLAAFAFRLTPETKEQIQGDWNGVIPDDMQEDPGIQQGLGIFRLLIGMMGDEVTLTVRGQHNGIPLMTAVFALENPQMTQNMLQAMMGLPTDATETYKGVPLMDVLALPLPEGVGLYYAFSDDLMMLSTDLPAMRTVVDRIQGDPGRTIFEPVDADAPRSSFLLLRGALISDVVLPVMGLSPEGDALDPDFAGGLRMVEGALDELRLSSGIEEGWLTTRLNVSLVNPALDAS